MTPDFNKPVDILAYLINEFGACECVDFAALIAYIRDFLQWTGANSRFVRHQYDLGMYYFVAGQFHRLNLAEHSGSMQHPSLTVDGERLLAALGKFRADEIENAEGIAYDGRTYTRGQP